MVGLKDTQYMDIESGKLGRISRKQKKVLKLVGRKRGKKSRARNCRKRLFAQYGKRKIVINQILKRYRKTLQRMARAYKSRLAGKKRIDMKKLLYKMAKVYLMMRLWNICTRAKGNLGEAKQRLLNWFNFMVSGKRKRVKKKGEKRKK